MPSRTLFHQRSKDVTIYVAPGCIVQEAAASMEQFEGEFPDMQKDAKRLRETIEEDLAEIRKKAELRRNQSLARRRAQAEMRQRLARRRGRQPDAAIDSNGAAAAQPRPPTPRPPVNPFLEASLRQGSVERQPEHVASCPATSSAAQAVTMEPSGLELRPGRDEAFRSGSAQSVEETPSDLPSGVQVGPTRQQVPCREEMPSSQDSGEMVPGPPPGSPPRREADAHAASARSAEGVSFDRALVECGQHENGDHAGASNEIPEPGVAPAEDRPALWQDDLVRFLHDNVCFQ
jgi:hypothetical protein